MTLRVVVFGSGAVLMGLEIVGSRVLAPFFGSSVYVWGSLISIFLAALSLGYYFGGVAADRWPRTGLLAAMLTVAGALILLLPVVGRPILEAFSLWDLGPRLSPLLASVVLFALPSVLMGATSPFAIKLAATDLATVGNTAGILYAISTAGSIVGTLLTAFVLIPAMGVRAILYTLGASLIVFSGLLAFKSARSRVLRPVVTTALALLLVSGPALGQGDLQWLVFEKDTVYHNIRVYEDVNWRLLRFDRSLQGGMLLKNHLVSPHRYPDFAHLAWLFNPDIKRVLMVGLGAGTISKRILSDYPQASVESVELDPVVVDVAKRFFQVTEEPRHRIIVQDGRQYIRRTQGGYDLIVMDAYNAEGLPFHLATREFLQLTKSKLAPGGVIAAHIVGFLEGSNSKLFRALFKTYASEFSGLYPFAVSVSVRRDEEEVRSIILIATSKGGVAKRDMIGILGRLRREKKASPVLQANYLDDLYQKPILTTDVPIITDDYPWRVDTLPVWGWEPERR
ncbi:MAG TPA: fused MFS/spermidine synthase [bacterium]|nr:fused MFS/spermidine synthase [bacterium]